MSFKLRRESTGPADNLETYERDKKNAANEGEASLEQFEQEGLKKSLSELEEGGGSDTSSSSSDTASTDSNEDGGDDTGGEDEFSFDTDEDPSDEPDEEDTDDSEEEVTEEEPEESEEDNSDDSEEEIKTESIRSIEPIPNDLMFRMENNFISGLADKALSAWSGFTFVVGVLASIGIKYGPSVLSGMFKIVLYTFARTFQLLNTIYTVCGQRIERTVNSTTRQAKRVQALLTSLEQVVQEGRVLSSLDKNETISVALVNGLATSDLARILRDQSLFTTNVFGKLLKGSRLEFESLEQIAANRYMEKHFDALVYLNQTPSKGVLTPFMEAHIPPPRGTKWYTLGKMPAGGFNLIISLPEPADNWNEIESNYNNSSFDMLGIPGQREVFALEPEELLRVLNATLELINANKKHEVFYEQLANARSGVLTTIRSLFIKLVQSKTRVSFKDSVAMPLFLKTSIATKVYLVAAMDIQDHNARVIANVLAFAEKNMKLYRKKKDQE